MSERSSGAASLTALAGILMILLGGWWMVAAEDPTWIDDIRFQTLFPPQMADAMRAMDVSTTLEWADDAMKTLMTIPPGVRKMVTESTEDYDREQGEEKVTMALFNALAEEQGMSADFFDRFKDERKKKKTA